MSENLQNTPAEHQQTEASLSSQFMDRMNALAQTMPGEAERIVALSTDAASLAEHIKTQAGERVDSAIDEYPKEHRDYLYVVSQLDTDTRKESVTGVTGLVTPRREDAKILGDKLGININHHYELATELTSEAVNYKNKKTSAARAKANRVDTSPQPVEQEEIEAFASEKEAGAWAKIFPELEKLESITQTPIASKLGRLAMRGNGTRSDKFYSKEEMETSFARQLSDLERKLKEMKRDAENTALRSDVYEHFPGLDPQNYDSPALQEFEKIRQELKANLTPEKYLEALEPFARQFKARLDEQERVRQAQFAQYRVNAAQSDPLNGIFNAFFSGATGSVGSQSSSRSHTRRHSIPEKPLTPEQKLEAEVKQEFAALRNDQSDKKALRNMLKKYHPDVNQGDSVAEEKSKIVSGMLDDFNQAQGKTK